MKRAIVIILLVALYNHTTGQAPTREDYLRKSKSQRTWSQVTTTTAIVFTAVGGALLLSGTNFTPFSTQSEYDKRNTQIGGIMLATAGAAIVGSIILHSASKRNERKARALTLNLDLKLETAKAYRYRQPEMNYYPALCLRIATR